MAKAASKQWAVWNTESDVPYWDLYDSLQDAVSSNVEGTEIYEGKFRKLGKFILKTEIVPYTSKTVVDSLKSKTKRKYTKRSKFWKK